jgi:hypothetical protein
MSIALINRPLSQRELQVIRLGLSTFRDGSGQQKEKGYDITETRPGWRDFERVFAEAFGGIAPERKKIFDVIVPFLTPGGSSLAGLSVKSKELTSWKQFAALETTSRTYLELANSPSLFFDDLRKIGLGPDDFVAMKNAEAFGTSILQTVRSWHDVALNEVWEFGGSPAKVSAEHSGYLVASMGIEKETRQRHYVLHGFSLNLPEAHRWEFISSRCLRGYDPAEPDEALYDWYANSGGQLKYYPRGVDALYSSPAFVLEKCEPMRVMDKAALMWPDLWGALPKDQ